MSPWINLIMFTALVSGYGVKMKRHNVFTVGDIVKVSTFMQHLFLWSWRFTLQVGLSLWRLSKAVDAQLPSITLSQSWQTRNSFSIKLRSFSARSQELYPFHASFTASLRKASWAVFHQIEWKWCDCTQTHTYAISLWSAHACMSKDKSVFSFTRRAAALYINYILFSPSSA